MEERFRLTREGIEKVEAMVKRCPGTWGKTLAIVMVNGFIIDCEKHGLIKALVKFLKTYKKLTGDGIDVEELLHLIQDQDKKTILIEVKR